MWGSGWGGGGGSGWGGGGVDRGGGGSHVDFKKVLCHMLPRPKKGCVVVSILVVYSHNIDQVYLR